MTSAVESKFNGGSNTAGVQEEDPFIQAMVLSIGAVQPMALLPAFELGVFEIIAKAGPKAELSSKQIASQLPATSPDSVTFLDHMLMLLATHGVFGCSLRHHEDGRHERLYSLTPASQYFVRNADGASAGDLLVLITSKANMYSWREVKNAILDGGIPFNRAHGMNLYQYAGEDDSFNKIFNRAMFSISNLYLPKILESYKGFEDFGSLVDVGGGQGMTLHAITSKYPFIRGINFDLPHVIQDAPPSPYVEHVAGDMFVSVPQGDVIMLKWVIHNWSDDDCVKLLKNCYKSTPKHGKVLVFETVLPTLPDKSSNVKYSCTLDVVMWVQTPGGRIRTREQFLALAIKAGFSGIRFDCRIYNFWAMEFFK